MKSLLSLIISFALVGKLFSQDTISYAEFYNPSNPINGKFVALGLHDISIINKDTTFYPITNYQIGLFKNGKRNGVFELYFIGKLSDTLASRCEYRNDTLLTSIDYFQNGNPKVINEYFDKNLMTTQYYYENGRKRLDINYTFCKNPYSDYDALWISYYKNGLVRYAGKMHAKAHTNFGEAYDTWFYYTDCGELCRIEKYSKRKEIETKEYDVKCGYYEWYDSK